MMNRLQDNHFRHIQIIDQNSTNSDLTAYLREVHRERRATVFLLPENYGPFWFFGTELYQSLPSPFIYTDPDLLLPEKVDDAFCTKLLEATRKYKVAKAGCALDISTPELFTDSVMFQLGRKWTVTEWEAQWWHMELETGIYAAEVDTTFHLFNKDFYDHSRFREGVRLAGEGFTMKHLPWYRAGIVPKAEEEFYQENRINGAWMSETLLLQMATETLDRRLRPSELQDAHGPRSS